MADQINRALFSHGVPPIQTADMSRAEQKQLPDAVRQTILAEL